MEGEDCSIELEKSESVGYLRTSAQKRFENDNCSHRLSIHLFNLVFATALLVTTEGRRAYSSADRSAVSQCLANN